MAKKARQHDAEETSTSDASSKALGFDLNQQELPKAIEKAALGSGGYPYDDNLKRKKYEKQLVTLQIELL